MFLLCCSLWMYAAIWPCILLFTHKFKQGRYCISESVYPSWFSYLYIDLHCVLSVSISVICYYKIFRFAFKKKREIQAQERATHSAMSKDFKTAKMMCLILIFMLFAWSPFTIMHIYVSARSGGLHQQGEAVKLAYVVVTHLLMLNSCVNPIVYSWQSSSFRRAYRDLLGITLSDSSRSFRRKTITNIETDDY